MLFHGISLPPCVIAMSNSEVLFLGIAFRIQMALGSIILLFAGSRVNFFPYTVLLLEQGLSFLTSKGTGNQMCYCRILTRQACMEPSILAEIPKTSHCHKLQFCLGLPCLIHAAFFPSLATPANRLFRICFCKCVTAI